MCYAPFGSSTPPSADTLSVGITCLKVAAHPAPRKIERLLVSDVGVVCLFNHFSFSAEVHHWTDFCFSAFKPKYLPYKSFAERSTLNYRGSDDLNQLTLFAKDCPNRVDGVFLFAMILGDILAGWRRQVSIVVLCVVFVGNRFQVVFVLVAFLPSFERLWLSVVMKAFTLCLERCFVLQSRFSLLATNTA